MKNAPHWDDTCIEENIGDIERAIRTVRKVADRLDERGSALADDGGEIFEIAGELSASALVLRNALERLRQAIRNISDGSCDN